jgi:DNA end-binding protein Ku
VPKSKRTAKHAELGASWAGTLTFGLVTVPVLLYPAHRTTTRGLRMLSKDGMPLARRYYCEHDGREIDADHLVRGFEVEPGKHVVVTETEFERLAPAKTRDIELRRFVDAAALDPIYFDRPYLLTPGSESTKAYRLLASAMERAGRAGIATFVMHGKERIIAILAEGGILRAETLRFADEVRTPEEIGLPEPPKADRNAASSVRKVIAARSKPELDPDELKDPLDEALKKLVAKQNRRGLRVIAPAEAADGDADEPIDLIEVLKRSLGGGRTSGEKARSRGRASAS